MLSAVLNTFMYLSEQASAVDRGHRHSDGRVQTAVWLRARNLTTAVAEPADEHDRHDRPGHDRFSDDAHTGGSPPPTGNQHVSNVGARQDDPSSQQASEPLPKRPRNQCGDGHNGATSDFLQTRNTIEEYSIFSTDEQDSDTESSVCSMPSAIRAAASTTASDSFTGDEWLHESRSSTIDISMNNIEKRDVTSKAMQTDALPRPRRCRVNGRATQTSIKESMSSLTQTDRHSNMFKTLDGPEALVTEAFLISCSIVARVAQETMREISHGLQDSTLATTALQAHEDDASYEERPPINDPVDLVCDTADEEVEVRWSDELAKWRKAHAETCPAPAVLRELLYQMQIDSDRFVVREDLERFVADDDEWSQGV